MYFPSSGLAPFSLYNECVGSIFSTRIQEYPRSETNLELHAASQAKGNILGHGKTWEEDIFQWNNEHNTDPGTWKYCIWDNGAHLTFSAITLVTRKSLFVEMCKMLLYWPRVFTGI